MKIIDVDIAINKAIKWILDNRNLLGIADISDWNRKMVLLKPIGEFVLTLDVLKSYDTKEPDIESGLSWAWQQFDEGNLLIDILLARPDLIMILSIYSNFARNGYENKKFETFAEYLLTLNSIKNIEYPLWRKIDLDYSTAKLQGKDFSIEAQLKDTWIGNYPEPWTINNDFAYSMTHEIFYATDFGKYNSLPTQLIEYIKFWLPAWMEIYANVPDWDIFAELIMVGECIDSTYDSHTSVEMLVKAQHENGLFPSPSGGGGSLIRRQDSQERVNFLTNYHTTFVSLMALIMYRNNMKTKSNISFTG